MSFPNHLPNVRPVRVVASSLTLGLLLSCGVANAGRPPDVTDAEIAMLPRYCPDTMGFKYGDATYNTSPNAGKWVALMGKGFWAVHHYCWGLIEVHRTERPGVPPVIKRGLLESAVGNFTYVLNNTEPDFILLPEILTWIGRTEIRLGRIGNAAAAFERAQTLKPDYWPAYSHWAEYLIASGKKAEAKKVVKAGLEYSPSARLLVEQYRSLGGNPGEIVPKALPEKPAADTVAADSSPQPAGPAATAPAPVPETTPTVTGK